MAAETADITIDAIEALIADQGYEITPAADNMLKIKDTESGVTIQAVLEENVLFLTVPCVSVNAEAITPDLMRMMLDAENGISTSSFQLYDQGEKIVITLNNFCKLLSLGEDDEDDIISCVEFLLIDVLTARAALKDLVK